MTSHIKFILMDRAQQRLTIMLRNVFYPLMHIAPESPREGPALNHKVICLYCQQVFGGKKSQTCVRHGLSIIFSIYFLILLDHQMGGIYCKRTNHIKSTELPTEQKTSRTSFWQMHCAITDNLIYVELNLKLQLFFLLLNLYRFLHPA